jgi:hypothetical protein
VHFRLHVSMPSTWLRWGQKQSLSHVPEEVILEEGVEGEGVEGEGVEGGAEVDIKAACKALHRTHKVRPGISWGSMGRAQEERWMNLHCDRFFCKPHEQEGKGIYKCEPL